MDIQRQISMNIQRVISPFGDDADLRERRRAIEFLLSVPEQSFPILMQFLKANPTALDVSELINVVGLFRRDESVELLVDLLLKGIENVSRAAGRALGMIGSQSAREALVKGLASQNEEVNISAIEGVRVSCNKEWCNDIETVLKHNNANVRYYAVYAASELGCVDLIQLEYIAEKDPDLHIRKLCLDWIKNHN